jgi:uncharacterized protein (DUF1499 family)
VEKLEMPGTHNNKLSPCPSSPNCVCSDSEDGKHRIKPYHLKAEPKQAWTTLKEIITLLPRTTIISSSTNYLHAEVRSLVFRFVDDVEFHLRPQQNLIAVRSAARLGHYDFGINRKRIEKIRKKLRSQGVLN